VLTFQVYIKSSHQKWKLAYYNNPHIVCCWESWISLLASTEWTRTQHNQSKGNTTVIKVKPLMAGKAVTVNNTVT